MKTTHKQVTNLLPSVTIDMGGFPVKQPMPTQKIQQVDPFLLLHHARTKYSDRRPARAQGVGPHPHRGFSPVTFVIEGEVHHRDSWENNQIAKQGEVQWVHAGAGIVHSERPSEALVARSGHQEIVQLWINSPASSKMKPPEYYYVSNSNMRTFTSEDKKITNKLIAGNYGSYKGNIIPQSDLLVMWSEGEEDGSQKLTIPKGFNSMLYLIKGDIYIKGYGLVEKEHLAVFDQEEGIVEVTFKEKGQFLLMCGKPINEKVTQSGPYVMNTQTEVLEAMRDYQMGKMGILIEED
ncbi:MAG: redox-sensitive bicupin YhaK (pirin superfamily) [bacterium]|jgi:redox-sensitive bicupin YhaK (pirin superfamily)